MDVPIMVSVAIGLVAGALVIAAAEHTADRRYCFGRGALVLSMRGASKTVAGDRRVLGRVARTLGMRLDG